MEKSILSLLNEVKLYSNEAVSSACYSDKGETELNLIEITVTEIEKLLKKLTVEQVADIAAGIVSKIFLSRNDNAYAICSGSYTTIQTLYGKEEADRVFQLTWWLYEQYYAYGKVYIRTLDQEDKPYTPSPTLNEIREVAVLMVDKVDVSGG